MSNFGWVPRPSDPPDDYLDRLALLVERRPEMEMIDIVSSIHDFIEEADTRAAPPPPIDDELVVGGHANRRGAWFVSPFTGAFQTDFEFLEESMNAPIQSIEIPDALIGFDPANPQPTARAFHVKGCSIGTARPLLIKLREALGDHVRVVAPKHFHGISTNGTPGVTPIEIIEWMAYEFVVFRKTAFPNVNALAAAFHAKGFTRPDGTPITLVSIKAWLRTLRVRRYDRAADVQREPRLPISLNIGGHRFARGLMAFSIQTPRTTLVVQTIGVPPPAVIPPTHAGRVAMLPAWLTTDEIFTDTHPFPFFKRIGYATLTDMIDGLQWRFVVDTTVSPPTIECQGGRFEYGLLIPIANPGTGGTLNPTRAPLIFNHVPESGAPATTPAFDETDTFFYETVP